jgi:hypothetical protein
LQHVVVVGLDNISLELEMGLDELLDELLPLNVFVPHHKPHTVSAIGGKGGGGGRPGDGE